MLRIEAGIPALAAELGPGTNPWEVGLASAISLDGERQFEGKAALTSLRARATRRLAVLRATADSPFEIGDPLFFQGLQIAILTSAARASESEPAVGLALLPANLATPGRLLHAGRENGTPAEVEAVRQHGATTLLQNPLSPDA